MLEEIRQDLALPRAEFDQAPGGVAFREPAEGLDKLRDDLAFRLRRGGLLG